MTSFVIRCLVTSAFACVLASCSTPAPLSFLESGPLTRAALDLYPVRVVAVDGSMHFRSPVAVAPGPHWLLLEGAPPRGMRIGIQQSFVFRVEPCTRYYLAARRASPLLAEWSLVVDSTEPVTPCDPQKELEKASLSDGAGKAPPAASPAQ